MVRITENDDLAKIAEKMNGREYSEELTDEEGEILETLGIVVVFGYSDDNLEFRGAIDDEVGSYGESETLVDQTGIIQNECGDDECPNFAELLKSRLHGIVSSSQDDGYTHLITANFPHETFEIREDGEKYCRGIAFRLSDTVTTA